MSLRTRLSLLSLGLLLVLLVAGGVFQYVALGEYLRRDEANVLLQRYGQTVTGLSVRGRICTSTGQLATAATRPAVRASPAVVAGQVTTAAAQCIVRALESPDVTAVAMDGRDGVIASAPDAVGPPTLALSEYLSANNGTLRPYYITGDSDNESLIVLHSLGTRNGHSLGVVQMSESTAALRQTQARLLTVLAVATGGLMVLALLLMPGLVGRALMPLRRVTEASVELAGGDFARRVAEPAALDELGRLARAFNGMAAAVQRAFALRAENEAEMRHFVGDASHELRTPLTTLQGQLDLLSRGAAADAGARRESLSAMQREVDRMSGLVEDLLTLTRLEGVGAAKDSTREAVDIDALVADAVDEQSVRAPQQRVEIEAGTPGQALTSGNADQLRRVILNLANNALAHAPGGMHTWRSRALDKEIVLSLSDQGPGIPAEALPRVFDRFFSGRSETGYAGSGSGLGLAIVKSVVEAHGGRVQASSSPAGTTIEVRLPRLARTA
jgi:two-component system, OmpR family, sensor kinase